MPALQERSGMHITGTPQLAGSMNDWIIFSLLISRISLTDPELTKLTGLSKPTVYQSLGRLAAMGLVEQTGLRTGGLGQKSKTFGVVSGLSHAAGIHVTPQVARVRISNILGETMGLASVPLPDRSAESMLCTVHEAFSGALRESGLEPSNIDRTVVGFPSAVSRDGSRMLKTTGLPGWEMDSTLNLMREVLGTDFQYENDANLAAIAEQQDPEVASVGNFILLWVGEGVGSAIVTHGVLCKGSHGLAGEIDNIVTPDGYPQRSNRFHTSVDAQSFIQLAAEYGLSSGAPLATMALAGSSRLGERGLRLLRAYAQRLAAGLATLVSVLDPGLIVLSGDLLAAGGQSLRSSTELALHRLTANKPSVSVSRITDCSVVQGAVNAGLEGIRAEIRQSFLALDRKPLSTSDKRAKGLSAGRIPAG